MKKLAIAIDGPAAAGKSTIAKRIAAKYEYTYIDTGAMYRSVALHCINHQIDIEDEASVNAILGSCHIALTNTGEVYLNDEEVTLKIRQNEISTLASRVSRYAKVRELLVKKQREMASAGGVVLDGRDIGTVVLPNADLKIYQIASVDARAMRRHKENIEKGIASDYETIKADIAKRDYEDMHRPISPLKKADDAIEIDTSDMTIDEVLLAVSTLIDQKLEG